MRNSGPAKSLRRGYTTGSCAAAAAAAAAELLLCATVPEAVALDTPNGTRLHLAVCAPTRTDQAASCAIRKDAGDDPDVTDGVLVFARVQRQTDSAEITIDGGEGIGRVTKPGLDQPVGAAAINSTPRAMIAQAVRRVCVRAGYAGGLSVVLSIPDGVALARKTYNPRLGIVGGISVLGTSGIVEPMSEQALIDTIAVELRVRRAAGDDPALLTPGNYGESFLRTALAIPSERAVKCSNFVGDAVDRAVELGFSRILLVGHLGKLVKLAAGILNTHSKYADARMEILAAHAALAGADRTVIAAILDCVATDDAISLLDHAGLRAATLQTLAAQIERHLTLRAGDGVLIGALVFSNRYGQLVQTAHANELLRAF